MVAGVRPRRDPPGDQPPDADDPLHVRRRGPAAGGGHRRPAGDADAGQGLAPRRQLPDGAADPRLRPGAHLRRRPVLGRGAPHRRRRRPRGRPAGPAAPGHPGGRRLQPDGLAHGPRLRAGAGRPLRRHVRLRPPRGLAPWPHGHRGLVLPAPHGRLRGGLGAQRGATGHGGGALPGRDELARGRLPAPRPLGAPGTPGADRVAPAPHRPRALRRARRGGPPPHGHGGGAGGGGGAGPGAPQQRDRGALGPGDDHGRLRVPTAGAGPGCPCPSRSGATPCSAGSTRPGRPNRSSPSPG